MKLQLHRPSPAMVVAVISLFVALGGSAFAYNLGRHSVHSVNLAKLKVRTGKLIDRDTTAYDGSPAAAFGSAKCKRGEKLIEGGYQQRSGSEASVVGHVSTIAAGPIPSERAFAVRMSSDLGGAARDDFLVIALCLP